MFAVKQGARDLLAALGDGYVTTDWVEMNQALYSALWIEKVAVGIAIGLIVAVAALNIVATLVLMVMEKHKDIAILVSMGPRAPRSLRLFMLQGTLIGALARRRGGSWGRGAAGSSTASRGAGPGERLPDRVGPLPARASRGGDRPGHRAPHLLRGDPLPGPGGGPPRPAEALRYD